MKGKSNVRATSIAPALRDRLVVTGRAYGWDALKAGATKLIGQLQKDGVVAKSLPAKYSQAITTQRDRASESSKAKGALIGERVSAGGDVAIAIREVKALLQDVRSAGVTAFDNEENYDPKHLALFVKAFVRVGVDPEKAVDALEDALGRVAGAAKLLPGAPALKSRAEALVKKMRTATSGKATAASDVSPEQATFLLEKGRLATMMKRASRAGVTAYRTTDAKKRKSYEMGTLVARKAGKKKAAKKGLAAAAGGSGAATT